MKLGGSEAQQRSLKNDGCDMTGLHLPKMTKTCLLKGLWPRKILNLTTFS